MHIRRQRVTNEILNGAITDLLTAIAAATEAIQASFYPGFSSGSVKTLTGVFQGLARRRIHAPNLYDYLARRSLDCLRDKRRRHQLDAQAVANTAWALAKLSIDQRETFNQLGAGAQLFRSLNVRAVDVWQYFNSQDIAKMVWAVATLGTWWNTAPVLGRHALAIAPTFTPQDADTALRAFGRLMILDQIPGLRTALNERATAASAASETRPTGAAPATKRVWGSRRGPTGTLASAALEYAASLIPGRVRPQWFGSRASTPVPFEDDSTQCRFCFDDYANPDDVTTLICGHTFHARCIIPWVIGRNLCPMCQGVVFE